MLKAYTNDPDYTWVWVNTYRYIMIHFSGMNIHLPAILGFTRYQGFDTLPHDYTALNIFDKVNVPRCHH